MAQIQQDKILKGSFWPENVRVISVKTIGENQIRIEAVGVGTQRFYNPILSSEDIKSIHIIEEKALQFTGDEESLFLFLESHIRDRGTAGKRVYGRRKTNAEGPENT
jgi:hypothetical protein